MLKKASHLMVLCTFGALAVHLLPNAPNFSLILGQTLQQERAALSPPATSGEPRKTINIERTPLRVIRDPRSSFSAVAVDVVRDEIVLQDELQEQITVYNRLDNTPPQAAMTEPKRVIGGVRTNIGSNCGVYVDQSSGDIYSVNGDITNWMSVFSREARGNVAADRSLHTPHRTFGIAVNEETQELFLTINHAPAVVVYRKMASGEEAPLRILEGDKTQLMDVQGIALDTKNQLMFVANRGARSRNKNNRGWARALKEGERTWEIPQQIEAWRNFIPGSGEFSPPSITVYPLQASGDTPPLRVIQGPLTKLNWPAHISVDVEHQELFVANTVTDEILVFRTTANGNVAPARILKGPRTGLKSPHGIYVDVKNEEIVVANFGNHAATVYRRTASGDTPPIRTIRAAPPNTPAPSLGSVGAVDYDTKRDQILAPNWVAFSRIAAFARLAKGGDAPEREIAGQKTLLNRAMHDIEYDEVNDEIVIANPFAQAILTYRGGADGEESPIRVLQGPSTQLAFPDYGVHVDSVHNELFVVEKEYILVFPRTAHGDVAPIRVIRGPDTGLVNTRGLAIDPIRNLLVVATEGGLKIFNRTDNGNVKPRAVIAGPKTGIQESLRSLRILPEKGWVIGILRDARGEGVQQQVDENVPRRLRPEGGIAVWSVNDNGDVPPIWLLTNPEANIGGLRVALNPKWKEVIVGGGLNVKTYSFPEIF